MPFSSGLSKNNILESPESIASSSTDNWFSSPTSSYDRSSISSIPWAEDAINQNKELWERIERIFYGEEPLPADKRTRDEFLEWMTKFPHIRVVGQQIPLHFDAATMGSDANHEDIYAIDPPSRHIVDKTTIDGNHHFGIVRPDRHMNCKSVQTQNAMFTDLELGIGKCLRITSGPSLSRGAVDDFEKVYKLKGRSIGVPLIKEEDAIRVTSVKSEMYNRHREPYANHRTDAMAPKYITTKIPPILTANEMYAKSHQSLINSRMAYVQPVRQQISLPAIRLVVPSKPSQIFVRSISAVGQPPKQSSGRLLNRRNSKQPLFGHVDG